MSSDFVVGGWEPDNPAGDKRDWFLPASISAPAALNPTHNRDVYSPKVKSQGRSNYCVDFCMAYASEHVDARTLGSVVELSPLFSSWNSRPDDRRGQNVGTQIRRAADAARLYGMCSEYAHPWELSESGDYMVRMRYEPPLDAYIEARNHQVTASYKIEDGNWDRVLAAIEQGYGVQFGIPVWQSVFDAPHDTGIISQYGSFAGYHAIYGMDLDVISGKVYVVGPNSWGSSWGKAGWFALDEAYMRQAEDIWVEVEQEIVS